MDFIEKLFGISPDGGDGSLEASILLVITMVVIAIGWRRRKKENQAR